MRCRAHHDLQRAGEWQWTWRPAFRSGHSASPHQRQATGLMRRTDNGRQNLSPRWRHVDPIAFVTVLSASQHCQCHSPLARHRLQGESALLTPGKAWSSCSILRAATHG